MPLEFLSAFSFAQVLGEIVGNRSDELFCKSWQRLKQNLATLTPDANHDLQRAVNCSYQQATLQICAIRCEQLGIDVDAWLRRETLLNMLQKPGDWFRRKAVTTIFSEPEQQLDNGRRLRDRFQQGKLQERLYSLLHSEEVKWLDRVLSSLRRQLGGIEVQTFQADSVISDNEVEILLQPSGRKAAEVGKDLRESLLVRVNKELGDTYGSPSEEISTLLKRHWFDFFCANFQYALKNDGKVFRIFTAKSQANLSGGLLDGVDVAGTPLTIEQVQKQFESFGGELSQRIERCAEELYKQQQSGFDEIKLHFNQLLPIITLVTDTSEIIGQLPDLLHATAVDIKTHTTQVTKESESNIIKYAGERFNGLEDKLADALHPHFSLQQHPTPKVVGNIDRYYQAIIDEFERLPLFPIARGSLSVGAINPVRLFSMMPGNKYPRLYQFQEIVDGTPRFVVVGPSGSGKTTALRWLTFKLAKQKLDTPATVDGSDEGVIPVFLNLTLYEYEDDLLNWIKKTLDVRGMELHDSELKIWLKQRRVLLLLDGYEQVKNRQFFHEDLNRLLLRSPEMRFVMTSRHIHAPAFALLDAPLFEVNSLYDYQIREIFKAHLDDNHAGRLFQLLENRNLLDAFRLPLMAGLITLAYQEPFSNSLLLAKGLLYQDVLTRILKDWEEKQSSATDYDIDLKLDCLARLGYEMILRSKSFLEVTDTLNCCDLVIQQRKGVRYSQPSGYLLDQLVAVGLLVKSNSESAERVNFWHQSFGEYFAAVWLKRNYRLASVLRLSSKSQWHETIVFLISLLEDSEARKLLLWLLKLARLSVWIAQTNPYNWATNQLFFVLRCLNNTGRSYSDLKDQFLDIITDRQLFLSGLTVSCEQVDFEGAYFQFNSLIGQLGTPRSRQYLLNESSRRYRVYGLAQFREIELLLELFKGTLDEDSSADIVTAGFLLKFPLDILLSTLGRFLEEEDAVSKVRLLRAINRCLHMESYGEESRYKELEHNIQWFELLTEFALNDKDEAIRHEAFIAIRNSTGGGLGLPSMAEQTFLIALKTENVDIRSIAINYLLYSTSDESLNAVINSLDDESWRVILSALHVLSLRDSDNLPDYVVKILRRIFPQEVSELDFRGILESIKDIPSDISVQEKILFLILGSFVPDVMPFRLYSVKSLVRLKLEPLTPFLVRVFNHEEEQQIRREALWGLSTILGKRAEPYLLEALEDPSPLIRSAAAVRFIRWHKDVVARALPRLRTMMEDSDSEVRTYAKIAVENYDKDT